jgi:hypothetical protein
VRIGRALAVGAVVLSVLLQPQAEAANRAGSLLRSRTVVTWTGGPFVLSEPNYVFTDCVGGESDPLCDHFALKIALGDGARIQVSITTASPNPNNGAQPLDGDDYDVFVYAPNGAKIAEAANTKGNESVVFAYRSRFGRQPYEIRVHPWFVMPGSTYKGTIRALTMGV